MAALPSAPGCRGRADSSGSGGRRRSDYVRQPVGQAGDGLRVDGRTLRRRHGREPVSQLLGVRDYKRKLASGEPDAVGWECERQVCDPSNAVEHVRGGVPFGR